MYSPGRSSAGRASSWRSSTTSPGSQPATGGRRRLLADPIAAQCDELAEGGVAWCQTRWHVKPAWAAYYANASNLYRRGLLAVWSFETGQKRILAIGHVSREWDVEPTSEALVEAPPAGLVRVAAGGAFCCGP